MESAAATAPTTSILEEAFCNKAAVNAALSVSCLEEEDEEEACPLASRDLLEVLSSVVVFCKSDGDAGNSSFVVSGTSLFCLSTEDLNMCTRAISCYFMLYLIYAKLGCCFIFQVTHKVTELDK